MKIYSAQLTPRIADIGHNTAIIINQYKKSVQMSCDICVTPELSLIGYTPKDMLFDQNFIHQITEANDVIAQLCTEKTILLLGTITTDGIHLYNSVLAIQHGKIIWQSAKKHLPNYQLFDEKRYFTPYMGNKILCIDGIKIAVVICEDLWHCDVVADVKSAGATLIISMNASPFEAGKKAKRENVAKARFNQSGLPILYCNQFLAHDGIIYDGGSFYYDGRGFRYAKFFKNDTLIIEIGAANQRYNHQEHSEIEEIYCALVEATKSYIADSGFIKCIIGLSGGIDSALVAAIAVDAIGSNNVATYMLQSPYTSEASIKDAAETAALLSAGHKIIDISKSLQTVSETIAQHETLGKIAYENLQARIRGTILMSISNSNAALLLTTGNKSEIATGYCTLYGDMCGAFNPIGDVYKSQVFDLARFRNTHKPDMITTYGPRCNVIAKNILLKEPSAELSFNQKDSDSLPPYDVLDGILKLYIEKSMDINQIVEHGYNYDVVQKVLQLVRLNEHKRKAAALCAKISSKCFNVDRRYPTIYFWAEFTKR